MVANTPKGVMTSPSHGAIVRVWQVGGERLPGGQHANGAGWDCSRAASAVRAFNVQAVRPSDRAGDARHSVCPRLEVGEVSRRDDASLTASERAALVRLEARAVADDPVLARRLRGSSRLPAIAHLRLVRMGSGRGGWGATLIVLGLILVALSLSTTWALGVVGSLMTAWGLWMGAGAVKRPCANTSSTGET